AGSSPHAPSFRSPSSRPVEMTSRRGGSGPANRFATVTPTNQRHEHRGADQRDAEPSPSEGHRVRPQPTGGYGRRFAGSGARRGSDGQFDHRPNEALHFGLVVVVVHAG